MFEIYEISKNTNGVTQQPQHGTTSQKIVKICINEKKKCWTEHEKKNPNTRNMNREIRETKHILSKNIHTKSSTYELVVTTAKNSSWHIIRTNFDPAYCYLCEITLSLSLSLFLSFWVSLDWYVVYILLIVRFIRFNDALLTLDYITNMHRYRYRYTHRHTYISLIVSRFPFDNRANLIDLVHDQNHF